MNTIRAWKDEDYRLSLSEAEQALVESPVGELTDAEMDQVAGGGCYITVVIGRCYITVKCFFTIYVD